MSIAYEDVFAILAEAIPEFPPAPDDWEDRLSYIYINDIVRYVCNWAYPDFEPLLRRFAALMERLFVEGDGRVHDLAHDALEELWGHHEERDLVAQFFGPRTEAVWLGISRGERGQ